VTDEPETIACGKLSAAQGDLEMMDGTLLLAGE
jgi:hypothetical protein